MAKLRCSFDGCKRAAERYVGDCTLCQGHFCSNHRILEDHTCKYLDDCKKEAFEQNASQLNKERTQVIKTA
ncbi:hypothetical protein N658DRAFT_419816 [Parathielavia hyrcaniae]|uniref:AN1-type domain-containing protein n=1 Tax=Parathielavia hyrcaniae TaxID=113614 RepID=A0AAN6Q5Y2_9PEZI|nr:hypothetical protein N658DRAFT_419816 [Parathielavia hyrcaniae]